MEDTNKETWKEKEWLKEHYYAKELSARQIADLCGVSKDTILYNMRKNGIDRRERVKSVRLAYEQGRFTGGSEKGRKGHPISPKTREKMVQGLRNKWKGHKTKHGKGYLMVKDENHNQVFEHRLVMEEKIGRKLLSTEDVHHINGNKTDNRKENLHLFKSRSDHSYFHKMKVLGRPVKLKYEYTKRGNEKC